MIQAPMKLAVIAPHPDDEVLGSGGTIARFAKKGIEVSVLVVSGHLPPLYNTNAFEATVAEAEKSMRVLGVSHWDFLKIPATMVHEVSVADLNGKIKRFLDDLNPHVVLLPFPDRHIDHRTIFDASVVACRPTHSQAPKIVLAYETLSETHWNVGGVEPAFAPDFFVDISDFIEVKQDALNCYASQIVDAPSRSVDACMALAKFRGSQNGCEYAEAFKVVRIVV
jgi:LmbE family N-acetylglucosaminyl deacetylase